MPRVWNSICPGKPLEFKRFSLHAHFPVLILACVRLHHYCDKTEAGVAAILMAAYLADLHGGAVAAPFNSAFTYRPPGIRSRISRGSLGAFPCGSPQSRRRRMPPLLTAIPKAACLAQPRLSASSNLLRRRRDGLTDHGTWTRTDRVAAHAVWLATWLSSSRELSASGCAALWRTWSIIRPS